MANDELTYEEFVRAHGLTPFVDIKTACRVTAQGHSRFYEQVKSGVFVIIRNGSRSNVTAKNLYEYYLDRIAAARSGDRT